MDDAFLREEIVRTKALIIAYDDAIMALTVSGKQQYTLDTGQSRISVTKLDLSNLTSQRSSLMNECSTLQGRLDGSGTTHGVPAW